MKVNNPGGDWNPGWGVDLRYAMNVHRVWVFHEINQDHFGGVNTKHLLPPLFLVQHPYKHGGVKLIHSSICYQSEDY